MKFKKKEKAYNLGLNEIEIILKDNKKSLIDFGFPEFKILENNEDELCELSEFEIKNLKLNFLKINK